MDGRRKMRKTHTNHYTDEPNKIYFLIELVITALRFYETPHPEFGILIISKIKSFTEFESEKLCLDGKSP